MAQARSNPTSLFGEEPDDDSFWLKLMAECLENPVTKLPTDKRLLVLGDNEAEKTLLFTKLQSSKTEVNFTKGNGLEFRYLTAKDEYCDSQTKLGVWLLDGDPFYKPLLKYALDDKCLPDTTVILVASMTKPWDIMNTINTWTNILKDYIQTLDMSDSDLELRKAKVLERFQEYVEPGLSIYGSLAADNTRELPVNIGIELIVVITKTEYMKELQTEFGYEEEHFDFIQLSLREFCLSHGAALFYVSVKEDKNCDLLVKYILHKIYAFPFRLPAILVERDAILVPAGWDTKNKIRFLSDTLTTIPSTTPFEDVVFKPTRLSDTKRFASEVVALKNQEFLAEMQIALERQASEEKVPESVKDTTSMTATVVQRNVARRMTRAQPNRSPQKKLEAKLVSGEGDNTLSNFFHSLLNRRTSAPVDRPVGFTGTRTMAPKKHLAHSTSTTTRNISEVESSNTNGDNLDYDFSETNEKNSSNGATPYSRKSSEESSENDSEGNANSKLKNTAHLSLDQDKDMPQLPEYFLSNPGAGSCTTDCSFQKESASSSFDFEDQFSPPLDRVRSSFNPPLKLLLEKPESKISSQESEVTNGITRNGEAILKNEGNLELDKDSIASLAFPRMVKPESKIPSQESEVTNGITRNEEAILKNEGNLELDKDSIASLAFPKMVKPESKIPSQESEVTNGITRNGEAILKNEGNLELDKDSIASLAFPKMVKPESKIPFLESEVTNGITRNGEATLKNEGNLELDKDSIASLAFPKIVEPDSVMSTMPLTNHDQNSECT